MEQISLSKKKLEKESLVLNEGLQTSEANNLPPKSNIPYDISTTNAPPPSYPSAPLPNPPPTMYPNFPPQQPNGMMMNPYVQTARNNIFNKSTAFGN